MFVAARAEVELSSVRSVRGVPVEDFVLGHYETALEEDELITRVVVPRPSGPAACRKLRTRSQEDRPAVAVAAVRRDDRVKKACRSCAVARLHAQPQPASTDLFRGTVLYSEGARPVHYGQLGRLAGQVEDVRQARHRYPAQLTDRGRRCAQLPDLDGEPVAAVLAAF